MIDLTNLEPSPEPPSYEQLSVQLLDAAIELTRIEHGEIGKTVAVAAVLSNLGLRNHQVASGDALRKAIDPKTIDIYGRVVSQLTAGTTRNIDDLAAHIKKYSSFSGDISQSSHDELLHMKQFFLALHRELLAENYNRLEESIPDRI